MQSPRAAHRTGRVYSSITGINRINEHEAFLPSLCFSREEDSCFVGMPAPGLSSLVQNLGNGQIFPRNIIRVRVPRVSLWGA